MIKEFIALWEKNKHILEKKYSKEHPKEYLDIVKDVISILNDETMWEGQTPDMERITEIDHGDCQGTLLYIISSKSYQPRDFWYVLVSYGSCSGCDTLKNIKSHSEWSPHNKDVPSVQQTADYMTLALHIVQGIKKLNAEDEDRV